MHYCSHSPAESILHEHGQPGVKGTLWLLIAPHYRHLAVN